MTKNQFRPSPRRLLATLLCAAALAPALFTGGAAVAQEAGLVSARVEALSTGEAPQSIDDLKALEARLKDLSTKLIASTVNVRVGPAQGSGVIISEDGYVLTAGHVCIEPDRNVTFTLSDGRRVQGKSLGMNTKLDSGLMKITTEGEYPAIEWGDSSKLKPGQWVVALGHPGGLERGRSPVLRLGRVLSTDDSVISTDCTLVGGDSGGPLCDLDGNVIGINSRIGGPLTVNLHVPTNQYRQSWDRLAAGELWGDDGRGRPYIGVKGDTDSLEAKIAQVYDGTPAEDAGVKPGDVIIRFDGEKVTDFASLAALVPRRHPGQEVNMVVRRPNAESGKAAEIELKIVIGGRAPSR